MKANIGKLTLEKDLSASSPQKRTASSGSFLVENSLTRREYQNKGKEMWQLNNNRKELEEKLKKLENRIKHLSFEQQKTEKVIECTKKKHESYSKIRDDAAQEKIYLNEVKLQQEKQMNDLKDKYQKESQELKQKIKENKMQLIDKNTNLKKNMNQTIQMSLMLKKEEEDKKRNKLKENAIKVSESIKRIHHKRNSSYQTLKQLKEEEYNNKMQQHIKAQEDAVKRIQELERIENEIMDKLESTQKIQETVNSILSSPAHKNINLLSFHL